jgi:hypothetical protein
MLGTTRATAIAAVRATALAGIVTALTLASPGIAHATLDADWEMNEVGSPPATMVDSSGGGHDGQPMGGIVGDGSTYTFDGTGVVDVADPDGTTLSPGTQDITITASVAFSNRPGHDYDIVRKKPAGVKGMQYRMEIMSTGKAKCFFTGDTGNAAIIAKPVLDDGQFHTITCTKTSSTIGITVDAKAKTKNVVIGSIVNATDISIGAKLPSGDDFVGSMDYVTLNYT